MSSSTTFSSSHPRFYSTAASFLFASCAIITGKIILFDLPPELKMPALATILPSVAALAYKIDDLSSKNEQILGGAMLLINGNIAVNWDSGYTEPSTGIQRTLKSDAISILETLKKHRFFFDRNIDKGIKLDSILDRKKAEFLTLSELAKHLSNESTQYQLKALAKEACDHAMGTVERELLQALSLTELAVKHQFYSDVYFYLRVWLKNSIEYDMEMPDIGRSIKNVSIYLEAFNFLRTKRTAYFLSPGDQFSSPTNELLKVIEQYLDCLISKLKSEDPDQGFLGRLLNPHH